MSKEQALSNAIDDYLNKAKPKILKPGTPEHDRAMAEMEAAKAGKPKSRNPAGVEHPSAAGSRDKLGERPLVEGIDKHFTGGSGLSPHETGRSHVHEGPENAPMSQADTDASFKRAAAASATWTPEQRRRKNPLYGRNPDTPNAAFPKMTAADKEMFTQNATTKPMGPFTKSVDLEDGSHSWDYQG